MKVFLVGGAIRDALLGLPVKDKDWVVTGATPEIMIAQGYRQVGRDFPVFLHPTNKEEYALARTEHKHGYGYNGFITKFSPYISIEQDLLRRDLTINAIAQDEDGHLIDPYNGQHDINNRLLRHVSGAFVEDPVRVLRIARFAAKLFHLNFTIAPETQELIKKIVNNGELNYITPERIWKETEKALSSLNPQIYFQVLRNLNALKIIFPELDHLYNIPCNYCPKINIGLHNLIVLKQISDVSEEIDLRFATLLHDLGESCIFYDNQAGNLSHKLLEISIIKNFCRRLHIPNYFYNLTIAINKFYHMVYYIKYQSATNIIQMLDELNAWRNHNIVNNLLLISKAHFVCQNNPRTRIFPQEIYFKNLFNLVKKISVKNIINKGITGSQIKHELKWQRISIIQEYINKFKYK